MNEKLNKAIEKSKPKKGLTNDTNESKNFTINYIN